MPAQLTTPTPTPTPSYFAVPTPESRWAAIEQELHGLKLIDEYWRRPDARTPQYDAEAVLLIYKRASDIFEHVEACAVTAARFPQETRDILSKLAAAHRARVASMPPPPPLARTNASRDPRRRLPSPPVPAQPQKDVSNDGGVARSHARRAPIVAKPYQRPTARKQKKVEVVEDVPPAIAASVRAAQADDRAQVQQVLEPIVGDVSLDDLCELFSSTSLNAASPLTSPAPSAAPAPSASPAPPASPVARAGTQPCTPPKSTRNLAPPPAPFSSRICGKPAPAPARLNPLDRSSRRRRKTAEL